jgi:DNA-binding LytR/AlgR family response regulator
MLRTYEKAHGVELDIETAADGAEVLARWKPERWDMIFLDIFMPQLNGVEAARQLRKHDNVCEIVFATTSRAHGIEGYEVRAMDYLTKPFTQEEVDDVMDWFIRQRTEKRSTLLVRTQSGDESVRTREICYIESFGHNCVIHAQGRNISVRGSIDKLCDGLDTGFFRCHKSYLLNFAHVVSLEKNEFLMDDGDKVPISAANLARSKSAFLAWKTGMP